MYYRTLRQIACAKCRLSSINVGLIGILLRVHGKIKPGTCYNFESFYFLILNLIFRPKGDDDDDEDEVGNDDDDDERGDGDGDGHTPHWLLPLLLGHPGRPHWLPGRVQFLWVHCAALQSISPHHKAPCHTTQNFS